jgi:hypothetical protein
MMISIKYYLYTTAAELSSAAQLTVVFVFLANDRGVC